MNLLQFLTPRRLTIGLLVVPTLLGALYYSVLASDRYVSESVITVHDDTGGASTASVASVALGSTNPLAISDIMYVASYIHSSDMLAKLDAKFHLRDHYAIPITDPFYRAWRWFSREEFLNYFRGRVTITPDQLSGLLTVDVEAFEPAFAQKVNRAIIEESEKFINDYGHLIALEQMGFAEAEVQRAQERVLQTRAKLLTFQTTHKLLDPTAQANANSSLTASLQSTLAQQESDLKVALAYLQDDAYQVRTLKAQIAATRSQLDAERVRGTSPTGGDQLASLNIEYQSLLTQAGFADDAYKAAVVAVEQARLDASRKLKTVILAEPPTLPDDAIYPQRFYNFLSVFVLCGVFLTILRLVVATIREHQD